MEKLNSDCLLKILLEFTFLERIALETVCIKWRHVLQHPCAYSDIKKLDASKFLQASTSDFFQQDTINFEPKMLGILQRCGPSLKELDFGSHWLKISQPIIQHVARYCHQLTKLDLGCIILNADISPILKVVAHRLEHFSLEETSWTNEDNAMKVNQFLPRMKSLIRLNLRRFMYSLENIVAVSYKLEVVDLSGTKRLSVQVLANFLTSHNHLREVMMCPFPYFHFQHSVFPTTKSKGTEGEDPARLQAAIDGFVGLKKLTTLSLGYINKSFLSLLPLAQLENLRVLHIQECSCLTSSSLQLILDKTTQLRILSLFNCAQITDYSSIAGLPVLGELDVKKTTQLCDLDLENLARNGILKRLRLEQCVNVCNKAVLTLAAACPLIELELSKCESIKEDLFSKGVWKKLHLQILSLNSTLNITNQSLSQLAASGLLDSLRELDVSHNKNIDDTAIECLHRIKASKKSKTLIIYVFQTGVTRAIKKQVHPLLELVF